MPNLCVLTVLCVEQCNDDTLWRGVGQSVGESLHSHLPTCKSSQRIGNLERLYLLLRSARYLAMLPEDSRGGGGSLKTRVTRSRRKEGVDRFGRESRWRWSPAEGSPLIEREPRPGAPVAASGGRVLPQLGLNTADNLHDGRG